MNAIFVFVHGSNSNSFSWSPMLREMTLLGHRALAVDLPGHGFNATFSASYQAPQDAAALAVAPSGLAGVPYADNIAHVIEVVRRAGGLGPVILVGHSRGGMTVTGVANAAPELLHRVVYMSAWCCVELTPREYTTEPEYASSALNDLGPELMAANPAELGSLRMNWRTADPAVLATLKTAMLAEGTDTEFLAALNTLEPDESLDAGDERVNPTTWGRLPHTYVRLTADRSIPIELQDRFIREADTLTPDNPFDVRTLDTSHMGFLLHPQEAASMLTELA
ncbi:alpha/beta hydrolase [Saccharothrix sp. ALI-22-I]|uniref:alpha/beta fold hydrolase n=1 Tax=Saccharothrix sp. ALI-22-I TaxID=1933778 RepID=UPI00097C874D|nr:alpha/beta hydrolase [Saccharothrix sp. ALI-22-I]ONI80386.1 alpha/beta hydrolase [Saccharothrix sp. ALI-22-I]